MQKCKRDIMKKIHYQCSNCGKRFQTSPIPGVPDGMYLLGCRAVGDAFYCEDCVRSWAERNGEEFDKQYKNPKGMFARWWNRTIDMQCTGKKIKRYRIENGMYVKECIKNKELKANYCHECGQAIDWGNGDEDI